VNRLTIVLSDDALAKAEAQAADAGWTPEMWVAWLVEDYTPPQELDPDSP
jgi:hypothetical protein